MLRRQASDSVSDNRQIKEAGNKKKRKKINSIMDKIISKIYTKGNSVQFDVDNISLEGKILEEKF